MMLSASNQQTAYRPPGYLYQQQHLQQSSGPHIAASSTFAPSQPRPSQQRGETGQEDPLEVEEILRQQIEETNKKISAYFRQQMHRQQ